MARHHPRSGIVLVAFVIVVAVGLAGTSVDAHHGWSGYDIGKTLNLSGVIRESGYEHPHGQLRLEVPGKTWLVVLAPPSRMERRGLTADMLKVGTRATVVGYPHRDHGEEMRAERITVNETTVELR
jgi:hypothetical protein